MSAPLVRVGGLVVLAGLLGGCVVPGGYAPGPVAYAPGPVDAGPVGVGYPGYYSSFAVNTGVWGSGYRVGPYNPGYHDRPGYRGPVGRPGGAPRPSWHAAPASHGTPFIPSGGRGGQRR